MKLQETTSKAITQPAQLEENKLFKKNQFKCLEIVDKTKTNNEMEKGILVIIVPIISQLKG